MAKILEDALAIYTDGSLAWKGRKGGYALVFVHFDAVGNDTVIDEYAPPGVQGTTGNRMELQAVVTALERAPDCTCYHEVQKVVIRTDSRYVVDNHKTALFQWSRNRWCNSAGRPIENADLWKDFCRLYKNASKRPELEWVKGHGKGREKDVHNYAADKLAKESRNSPLLKREYFSSVRRKTSTLRTRRGSIEPIGQTVSIRVIETKWLPQRIWKYRCEVVSPNDRDSGCVDFLYSELQLRDGHSYEVTLNADKKNPMIVALLRELEAPQ